MRIKAIKLDFEIPSHVVKADRLNVDISNLDESLFMRIASGRITISVDAVKEPIVLETEVLDYILQIKEALECIDAGQDRSFAVDRDYYSNNVHFELNRRTKQLTIREMNGGLFKLELPYSLFCESFLDFYSRAINIFQRLYPELLKNKAFLKYSVKGRSSFSS